MTHTELEGVLGSQVCGFLGEYKHRIEKNRVSMVHEKAIN